MNQPSPKNILRWFDPRGRETGTWAFILNRITGLGLSLYLFLHLFALGQLAIGEEAYNNFIAFAHNPILKIGEMFVIAAVLIHGLNGIRIALASAGIGVNQQKKVFVILMAVALVGIVYFAYRMFSV